VWLGTGLALLMAAQLYWALSRAMVGSSGVGERTVGVSSVRDLGRVLFTDYMFAFEVTSILIIVAMIGAVVLTRRQGEDA
jgi:NADH-quinone oxidoreductase subunit J